MQTIHQPSPMNTGTDCFSPEELQQFSEQGFVVVRRLAPLDICQQMLSVSQDQLAKETSIGEVELEADLAYPGAPSKRGDAGGQTIRRLKQSISRHPVFLRWVCHPSIVGRLQQLIGPKIIMPMAHHNCIMTKQPQYSSDTGWHQDIRYWSFQNASLVNTWLALGDETPENGCMQVIPGSHKMDIRKDQLDEELFFRSDVPENEEVIASKVSVELAPGDVLFFHCRLLHAATRNFSDQTKFSVVHTFRPVNNPPLPGTRSASLPEIMITPCDGADHNSSV